VIIMMHVLRLAALASVLVASTVSVQAQNAACRDVQFSDDVLSRFPKAPASCLDVIERDGQHYAVFKAELQEVRGNNLRVRIKNPDGSYSATTSIATKPGRKVLIDGKPYPVSELAADQELTAYVRVDRPMIALPSATESEPLDVVPFADDGPVRVASSGSPTMPHTASSLGVVALLGQFSLAVALAMTVIRKRRK
jgi:hypothetical protein